MNGVLHMVSAVLLEQKLPAGYTAPQVPTREELVDRLIGDAWLAGLSLTVDGAGVIIDLWARARDDADGPAPGDGSPILTPVVGTVYDMVHGVLDRLAPDRTLASPGSAAWLLDLYTFGADDDGAPWRHAAHTRGEDEICALTVNMRVVVDPADLEPEY